MLDFVYWPISAILWFWHKVFSFVLDPGSGLSWILAIVALTFTIRGLLVVPTIKQMRSMVKMQEIQPQMREIQKKYKNDKMKLTEETRRLQKEAGVNPIGGCLPMLVQMPVFIGLFHVLRSFNRTGTGPGQLGLSVEENRQLSNYIFSPTDVQSFLDARLWKVPLSAYISMKESAYAAFQPVDFTRTDILIVTVPIIIMIAVATHFNGRLTVNRNKRRLREGLTPPPEGMMATQAEMMNKMMVWVFPMIILVTGAVWHIGLLFYMLSNNVWTYAQQHLLFRKMDREEAEALAAKKAAKRGSAPKPGVKVVYDPKTGTKKAVGVDGVSDRDDTPTPSTTPAVTAQDPDEKPKGFFALFGDLWRQAKEAGEADIAAKREKLLAEQQAAQAKTVAETDNDSPESAAENNDASPVDAESPKQPQATSNPPEQPGPKPGQPKKRQKPGGRPTGTGRKKKRKKKR